MAFKKFIHNIMIWVTDMKSHTLETRYNRCLVVTLSKIQAINKYY